MRQIVVWLAPTPTFTRVKVGVGGGERMRSLPLQIFTSSFFVIKSINYIHLSDEYKLPILSLKRLNLTISTNKNKKLKPKYDLFSA
jgi:hypothetical protein